MAVNISDSEPIFANLTGNIALSATPTAHWSVGSIIDVACSIASFFICAVVLLTFAKYASLWTPFNIYVINLVLKHLLASFLLLPLEAINNMYRTWPLSNAACTLYLYWQLILDAGGVASHVLITIDRLWAILFPLSYKSNRSVKMAIVKCVVSWIYPHLMLLPGLIRDHLYFRVPLNLYPCVPNLGAQHNWGIIFIFSQYVIPYLFILSAYPVVWYKRHQQGQARRRLKGALALSGTQTNNHQHTGSTVPVSTLVDVRSNSIRPGHTSEEVTGNNGKMPETLAAPVRRKLKLGTPSNFTLLTLLTIEVLLTWTPQIVFTGMLNFVILDAPVFMESASTLVCIANVLEPILCVASLHEVRQKLVRMFRRS